MSSSHLPQLRTDLTLHEQETVDGATLIVKDPVSGEFFRLQAAAAFIARQCNGETPPDVIQQRAEAAFGQRLTADELSAFLRSLDRSGLLETERGERARNQTRRKRHQGSTLYMRYRVVDPDRILDWLMPRTRFFFTPAFVVLSALLIVLAIGIGIFNWSYILQGALDLVRLSTLPLLVATIFLALTAHEFAHGLTCKHFGGEVREMGLMLLYFQPAFYCNVSDAWLFPEKRKRLWVGFAGPYFELFLWALAAILWRITAVDTWINEASLVLMATSGVKTLFNFIPLIKLDGYYLLSDYLEIPNLRKKSFRYLGSLLKRVAGLRGRLPAIPRRERRIYLIYGVAAVVFSVSLLLSIAGTWGEYLIVERQRLVFLALTALVGVRLRILARKLFGGDFGESGSRRSRSSRRESADPDHERDHSSNYRFTPASQGPSYVYVRARGGTARARAGETDPAPLRERPDSRDEDAERGRRAEGGDGAAGAGAAVRETSGAGDPAATTGAGPERTATADTTGPATPRRDSSTGTDPADEGEDPDARTGSTAASHGGSGHGSSGDRSSGSGSSSGGGSGRSSRRRRRRRWRRIRRWSVRLAVVGAIGVLLFAVRIELRVAGSVDILPLHNADVRADIDGTVAEVYVDEGDHVEEGDLIARLYDHDNRAELQKTKAEIQKAQAELDELVAGPTKEEIEVARSAVASARRELEFARNNLARTKTLFEREVVSQKEYDAARETVAKGENRLTEAKSELDVLLAGTREEAVRGARAELERLRVQRQYLQEQVERARVRSPATGIVTTPTRQLDGMRGKAVSKGGLIAKVHQLDTVTVEATVSEKEMADVKIGQTIGVKPRAYPNRVFYGKVQKIASTTVGSSAASSDGSDGGNADSTSAGSATTIRLTTELDNDAGLLKPGMTGMAKVYCGERRIIDLIIRRLSRTFRVEFWSWY